MNSLFLVIATFFLTVISAHAETVKIAVTDYPPYIQLSEKIPKGSCIEITKAAFKLSGLDTEFVEMSWQGGYNSVLKGTIDATMPYVKTEKRLLDFHYSESLIVDPYKFFYMRTNDKIPADFSWGNLSNFKKMNVGGTLGYFYINLFEKEGQKLDLVGTDETNIKKLFHHRIDFFVISEAAGLAMIKKMYPDKTHLFKTVNKPLSTAPMYLIMKKNKKGNTLINKFNEGLRILKNSGEYDRILKKYSQDH